MFCKKELTTTTTCRILCFVFIILCGSERASSLWKYFNFVPFPGPHSLPFSDVGTVLLYCWSSSLGLLTCVIMDVLSIGRSTPPIFFLFFKKKKIQKKKKTSPFLLSEGRTVLSSPAPPPPPLLIPRPTSHYDYH